MGRAPERVAAVRFAGRMVIQEGRSAGARRNEMFACLLCVRLCKGEMKKLDV